MAKLSFETIRDYVYQELRQGRKDGDPWPDVVATFPDNVVYRLDGTTYQRSFKIEDGSISWTAQPVKVKETRSFQPVKASTFSISGFSEPDDDGFVEWQGKVFEVGEYEDKDFSLTEEEADAAIAAFAPVENDIEHKSSVLDGKLGQLEKVWRDGTAIFGSLRVPKWLADLVEKPLKVSLAWSRDTKQIVGNALTVSPRIADAAVFHVQEEASAGSGEPEPGDKDKPAYRGAMSGIKEFFNKLRGLSDEEIEQLNNSGIDPVEFVRLKSEKEEREKELELSRARIREQEEARLQEAAVAFADKLLEGDAKKIVPAQKDAVAALFVACTVRDAGEKALFTDGKPAEGDAVKALKAFFDNAPGLKFTGEKVEGAEFVLHTGTKPDGDTVSKERLEQLQSMRLSKQRGNQ